MEGESVIRSEGDQTAARLATACDHLEAVLETVDLERDRELAEAVLEAVTATDQAYRLERRRSGRSFSGRKGGRLD